MVGIYLVVSSYLICSRVTILKGPKRRTVRDVAREATTDLKYSSITK